MKLPDVLLLFIVYSLVVAAGVGAYVYFLSRRPRPKQSGLAIPNVSGMNVKRAERNIVAWPLAEPPAGPEPSAAAIAPKTEMTPVSSLAGGIIAAHTVDIDGYRTAYGAFTAIAVVAAILTLALKSKTAEARSR